MGRPQVAAIDVPSQCVQEKRKQSDLSEDTPEEDKILSSKFSAELNPDKKSTAIAEHGPTPAVSNQILLSKAPATMLMMKQPDFMC
ncbi:hypothetical protein DITRI_Ditri04bG0155400 [Diplodiscus trichospermus]